MIYHNTATQYWETIHPSECFLISFCIINISHLSPNSIIQALLLTCKLDFSSTIGVWLALGKFVAYFEEAVMIIVSTGISYNAAP